MKLLNFIHEQIIQLDISVSKKETILTLVKNYDLSEAQKVLNSCLSPEASHLNTTLLLLISEIDRHIDMFNDDLEADEIIYYE